MANIKITAPAPLYDGMAVLFKAPCACTAVEGLAVSYGGVEKVFTFKDAHGNSLTGIGNLFAEGAIVKALLDTVNGFAYLQNADTNAYLEERLGGKVSKAGDTMTGDLLVERAGTASVRTINPETNRRTTMQTQGVASYFLNGSTEEDEYFGLALSKGTPELLNLITKQAGEKVKYSPIAVVETGTWTPTFSEGSVFTAESATYVKVGRIVSVSVRIYMNNSTADRVDFGGLPYTTGLVAFGHFHTNYSGNRPGLVAGHVYASGNSAWLARTDVAYDSRFITPSEIGGGNPIRVNIVYETNG